MRYAIDSDDVSHIISGVRFSDKPSMSKTMVPQLALECNLNMELVQDIGAVYGRGEVARQIGERILRANESRLCAVASQDHV